MTATILLTLCEYRRGSADEKVYLDVFGPGLDMASMDITNRMGKTMVYKIPATATHAYRVRVHRGSRLPDQAYQPTANFVVPGPQHKLPITQFVCDAMCTSVA